MYKLLFSFAVYSSLTFVNTAKAQIIFSCETLNNKRVEVRDSGETINYKFGRDLSNPEMNLSVSRSMASTWQWHGVGREMNYSVTIPNGNTEYTVFFSVDRLSEGYPLTSGVVVKINKQPKATVFCNSSTLVQHLEGIDLKPEQ